MGIDLSKLDLDSFMDIKIFSRVSQPLYTDITPNPKATDRIPAVLSVRQIPRLSDKVLQEEGKNEQARNEAMKREEDRQMVTDLIKKSNRCIISISSLFPWDFFPKTIEVEESRVTLTFRQFLSSQSYSVNLKDISNVFIESSALFASLTIISRTFVENDITINHLDAKKARRVYMIIEGLRTFSEHNIDTSNYEVNELIAKIGEFHRNKTIGGGETT